MSRRWWHKSSSLIKQSVQEMFRPNPALYRAGPDGAAEADEIYPWGPEGERYLATLNDLRRRGLLPRLPARYVLSLYAKQQEALPLINKVLAGEPLTDDENVRLLRLGTEIHQLATAVGDFMAMVAQRVLDASDMLYGIAGFCPRCGARDLTPIYQAERDGAISPELAEQLAEEGYDEEDLICTSCGEAMTIDEWDDIVAGMSTDNRQMASQLYHYLWMWRQARNSKSVLDKLAAIDYAINAMHQSGPVVAQAFGFDDLPSGFGPYGLLEAIKLHPDQWPPELKAALEKQD